MMSNTCLNIILRTFHFEKNYCKSLRLLSMLRLVGPIRTRQHAIARPLTCSSTCSSSQGKSIEEVDEFLASRTYTATPKYRLSLIRRKYAKEGVASGIDPGLMWPTKEELEAKIEEDKEWEPSLKEMQDELLLEQQEKEQKAIKKAKTIEDNMKKMPKLIADFKKRELEKLALEDAAKEKRQRLLEEAKEKMGYAIDPRNPRFQQMLADIEKEEKKKKKELKRKGIIVD